MTVYDGSKMLALDGIQMAGHCSVCGAFANLAEFDVVPVHDAMDMENRDPDAPWMDIRVMTRGRCMGCVMAKLKTWAKGRPRSEP